MKQELGMKLLLIPLLLSYIFSCVATAENATYEAAILNTKTDPSRQNVINLGGHLRGAARHKLITGINPYFEKIQVTLLSIPGHADYFAKEIQISRAKAIDRQAREGGEIRWEDYDDVRSAAIHTLENLPSPEAVRVLGELLSDSEKTGPQISEGHLPDAFGPPPNASLAADALKLLIEKPPVPQDRNWQKKGDIEAWKLWYEQIQSDNRTFRFKGDPKDYDLTGPASNDKLQRVERNLKRDDERTAGQKKSSTPVGTQTIADSAGRTYAIAGLVTTLALVAAALWYFLRGRRAT